MPFQADESPSCLASCHLIAKNFERIGDHATNIAETDSYIVTGTKMGNPRPKSDTTSTTSITAAKDA